MSLIRSAKSLLRQTIQFYHRPQFRHFSETEENENVSEPDIDNSVDPQDDPRKILVSNNVVSHPTSKFRFPSSLSIQLMGRVIGNVKTKELIRGNKKDTYAAFGVITAHSTHDGVGLFTQKHQVIVPEFETKAFSKAVRLISRAIVGLSGDLHYRYYMHHKLGIYVPYVEIVAEKLYFFSTWNYDLRRNSSAEVPNDDVSDQYS